jgi:hydrogenase maturation protease
VTDVLVIGFGSDLRGDDAAGRHVADAVERRALAGVSVRTPSQLVPELVEPISRAERVVFVDASLDVDRVAVTPVEPRARSTDSHRATPEELLGLAGALGLPCPPAFLVEIPARDLSLREGLDPRTAADVEIAVEAVLGLIATV